MRLLGSRASPSGSALRAVQQQAASKAELRSGSNTRVFDSSIRVRCFASNSLERATLSLNMLCYAELILESSTLV